MMIESAGAIEWKAGKTIPVGDDLSTILIV